MKRSRTSFLFEWLNSSQRKPLVIRGARQVGKTWLIRDFAAAIGLRLLEVNFEKRPELETLFSSNNPDEIMLNLRSILGGDISLTGSLLFLDEIQAAPHLLAKLRWFAEDMPQLPVIAAGSLLEFALDKHSFSMPVGRINYMYLEPFSFEEFLDATGQHGLREFIEGYDWRSSIPGAIHSQLIKMGKEYMIVGGMPSAVLAWIESRLPEKVSQVHFDLLATYRDDFAKYRERLSLERLEEVMTAVPRQLGGKFVYSRVNPSVSSEPLKQALELLSKARVCHRVISSSANGLPLGAEINEKYTKVLMLDCGLCGASLGLTLQQLNAVDELILVNKGGMAEQLVGQLLRTLSPPFVSPALYYWQRGEKGSSAEIDYVVQHESSIIPVEVKAGSTGGLKSLHQFMKEKKRPTAVRVNSDVPSITPVNIKDSPNDSVQYKLLSLPFYLLGQLHRLVNSA
ncbi:MAG: DUF4143 domain-containing protein [Nitrosomonas sp.]|nr:MAG: DUF4143 domain-containing protein [Nitrosomonas sp.]